MIYATIQETSWVNLEENLALLQHDESTPVILIQSIRIALDHRRPLPVGGLVFTDDRAPIESITNQMVLDNILSDPELLGE
jgi:hypothetical protein